MKRRRGIMRTRNIPTIDYMRDDIAEAKIGYAEVLRQLKKIKRSVGLLRLDELPAWQKMIVDEQKEYGFACRGEARGVLRSSGIHSFQNQSIIKMHRRPKRYRDSWANGSVT